MHAAGFMADRHEANPIRLQRREKGIDFGTWQSENEFDPLVSHGTGEQLTASYISHCFLLSKYVVRVSFDAVTTTHRHCYTLQNNASLWKLDN